MDKLATNHNKIIVGRLGVPYGVRGWIKVNSFTKPKDNILNYQPWLIDIRGKQQTVTLADHKPHGKSIVVLIEGCKDRDAAATYTNATITIYREQLPALAENEYYWTDLEGLTVYNHDETVLGTIEYIMSTGSNDVLVVKGDKEYLIPYLPKDVIVNINLAARTMHVKWDEE